MLVSRIQRGKKAFEIILGKKKTADEAENVEMAFF